MKQVAEATVGELLERARPGASLCLGGPYRMAFVNIVEIGADDRELSLIEKSPSDHTGMRRAGLVRRTDHCRRRA